MRRRIDRLLWPVVSHLAGYIALLALTPVMAIVAGSLSLSVHSEALQTIVMWMALAGSAVWALAVTASYGRFHEWRSRVQAEIRSRPDIIPITSRRSRGRK